MRSGLNWLTIFIHGRFLCWWCSASEMNFQEKINKISMHMCVYVCGAGEGFSQRRENLWFWVSTETEHCIWCQVFKTYSKQRAWLATECNTSEVVSEGMRRRDVSHSTPAKAGRKEWGVPSPVIGVSGRWLHRGVEFKGVTRYRGHDTHKNSSVPLLLRRNIIS